VTIAGPDRRASAARTQGAGWNGSAHPQMSRSGCSVRLAPSWKTMSALACTSRRRGSKAHSLSSATLNAPRPAPFLTAPDQAALLPLPLSRPSRSHGASADARPRAPGHWFLAPEPARRASWRCAPVHLNQTRHSSPSNLHLCPPPPSSHASSAAARSAPSRRAVPQPPPPRARRQAGDSLESVDGVSVRGASLSGLAQLLLGPAGSSVELRLVAAKTGAPPAR